MCDRIKEKECQDIPSIHGNISGLKRSEIASLERAYRRRVPPGDIVTPELARYISSLSRQTGRQVGLLLTREGGVTHVIVGDAKGIFIPSVASCREGNFLGRG